MGLTTSMELLWNKGVNRPCPFIGDAYCVALIGIYRTRSGGSSDSEITEQLWVGSNGGVVSEAGVHPLCRRLRQQRPEQTPFPD